MKPEDLVNAFKNTLIGYVEEVKKGSFFNRGDDNDAAEGLAKNEVVKSFTACPPHTRGALIAHLFMIMSMENENSKLQLMLIRRARALCKELQSLIPGHELLKNQ